MAQRTGDGGEVAAKVPNLSPSGEDRLSALHDDILVLILLRLDTIAEAARTSVLSSRWRRIWTLLPDLIFFSDPDDRHILEVLAASEAPDLRRIVVFTNDSDPVDSVAAWLPLAARRLSGAFMYYNSAEGQREYVLGEEDEGEKGTIALPCFGNATRIFLNLRFFSLALPPSGAFTRLTELILKRVRFQGTCELGDMISSPRCPCLQNLQIRYAWGVTRLTVRSESLLQVDLFWLNGFQQLNIDAPVLNELALFGCFRRNQPVVNISAPQLISLIWRDDFDPSYVQLGNLGQLQRLSTNTILVYGHHHGLNRNVLRLLQHFPVIHSLNTVLVYPPEDICNLPYLMEDITYLPHVTFLTMYVMNREHAFGAVLFHMIRLCTGIRRLSVVILKAQSTCPAGCICDQPTNWKIEKLSLNCLQEVEITGLKGTEHEFAFLKGLFNWAGVLEKLRIAFDNSVSKSKAKEFCQKLSSISTLIEC